MQHKKLLVIVPLVFLLLISISIELPQVLIPSTGSIGHGVYAISGSAQDIQAAVDIVAATWGYGNVYLPAGTWNFVDVGQPWVSVVIPAGINLFGAPTQRDVSNQVVPPWATSLIMPYDVLGSVNSPKTWFRIQGNADVNKPSRFSDIELVGYRFFNSSSVTYHNAISLSNVINFRIDHCRFQDTTGGINIGSEPLPCCGVVDHCVLNNTRVHIVPQSEDCDAGYGVSFIRALNRGVTAWENLSQVLGQYTDHSIFIEDCYFSKWRHCTSSNDDAHIVFRHNVVRDDVAYASTDAHGSYATVGSENRVGTRLYEIYDNEYLTPIYDPNMSPAGVKLAIHIRGGAAVIFNNYIQNHMQFTWLSNDDGNLNYVQKCKTHDVWFYNNILNNDGSHPLQSIISNNDPTNIVEGIDYTTASWTQNGAAYTLPILGSESQVSYQPYVYPHPLTL